jgi:hypothetical protein
MGERRHTRRQKSFLRGFVEFDKRRGAMNCLIRDLSDDGAHIIFSESVAIPNVIDLHIPQKNKTLRAKVEWRHGDQIGLSFAADAPADAPELTARIAQLEVEITALQVLKRLKGEKPHQDEEAAA